MKNNGSPVIATSGLTVEANTRRFAVDERKEEYYRAEVQNRVYKRQLLEVRLFQIIAIVSEYFFLNNYVFLYHIFCNSWSRKKNVWKSWWSPREYCIYAHIPEILNLHRLGGILSKI